MGQYGIIWFTIIFSGLVLTGGPLYTYKGHQPLVGFRRKTYYPARIIIKNLTEPQNKLWTGGIVLRKEPTACPFLPNR